MINFIKKIKDFTDEIINRTTMYRLVIYCLSILIIIAAIFGYLGIMPYSPVYLLFSAIFITAVCWLINLIFANVFEAPSNFESAIITALILTIIITPPQGWNDAQYFALAGWAAILAMASKYVLAIGKKHIINPAALAVVITSFTLNLSASWWIGTAAMTPFVFVLGALITRKIKRWDLVLAFFFAAFITILTPKIIAGENIVVGAEKIMLLSPILFFAFIMLTEPMTTPPTKNLQIIYGALVGFLFAPWVNLGGIYFTPELALISGNFFSYLVSSKTKLILSFQQKIKIANNEYDFIFNSPQNLKFKPGQYMEWTLAHPRPDNRGIRRFFTIASSPTENKIRLGIKFYDPPSSFKKKLAAFERGDEIVATQLAGDFTLPNNPDKKIIFMAGGIGITPFRSMLKYLIDTNEKRPIIVFYSNKTPGDIAYGGILEEAEEKLGIKTIYSLTGEETAPMPRYNIRGRLTPQIISKEVPDYKERIFYISGPPSMVNQFSGILKKMGIPKRKIKIDFFPGFA
ncbi:MAG: RnfABCDGE type electron transport complex subunit D [Patescibacteria group bacterium]|nr:RnfABCDGE type electron transport complex subunit D [Patescibacteria group bacterium]